MARPSLIDPTALEWIEGAETDSVAGTGIASEPGIAQVGVAMLTLESHHWTRITMGIWATLGVALGGFLIGAGLGIDGASDAAARNALVIAGLVLVVGCGAGGIALFRAARRINSALLWWAEQDGRLEQFSWRRLWRNEGPFIFLLGPVLMALTLVGWIYTAAAVASAELLVMPFGLAFAAAFNVATVATVLHAARRAKIARPEERDDLALP